MSLAASVCNEVDHWGISIQLVMLFMCLSHLLDCFRDYKFMLFNAERTPNSRDNLKHLSSFFTFMLAPFPSSYSSRVGLLESYADALRVMVTRAAWSISVHSFSRSFICVQPLHHMRSLVDSCTRRKTRSHSDSLRSRPRCRIYLFDKKRRKRSGSSPSLCVTYFCSIF